MLICECMFMVLTTRLSIPIALRSSFRNINGKRGAGAPGGRRVLGGNTSTYACYDNRLSYLCFSETNPNRRLSSYERKQAGDRIQCGLFPSPSHLDYNRSLWESQVRS